MEVTFNQYGYFEYGPISGDMLRLRKEVEDMTDDELINEVSYSAYQSDDLDEIAMKFAFTEEALTEDDREKLIGYYILLHCHNDLELERGLDD